MSVATLDTHEVVKELLAAGFTDEQAEAVARNLRKAQDLDLSTLATKVDIEAVRTDVEKVRTDVERVRTDVEKVRGDLRAETEKVRGELRETKYEILKWTLGVVGVQTLILLGTLIKLVKP